jgi:hypothetical protein
MLNEKIASLIEDLDSCLKRLLVEIKEHSLALCKFSTEAYEQTLKDLQIDAWKTIESKTYIKSNQADLIAKIAEFNARLLVRNALVAALPENIQCIYLQ